MRSSMKLTDFCRGKSKQLIDFANEISTYRCKDSPNYNKLKKLLAACMKNTVVETDSNTESDVSKMD